MEAPPADGAPHQFVHATARPITCPIHSFAPPAAAPQRPVGLELEHHDDLATITEWGHAG